MQQRDAESVIFKWNGHVVEPGSLEFDILRCVIAHNKTQAPLVQVTISGHTVGANSGDDGLLSPRQRDITNLVVHGLANKEISMQLALSEKTIKNHLGMIFDKLRVVSRSQLVAWALTFGGFTYQGADVKKV